MIKPLSQKTFLKTFDYVPRLAISLVIENKKGQVLLARRAIPPQKEFWHMPGSFILKGESLQNCIKRIILKELGLKISTKSAKLVGVFDDLHKDLRGHVVDVIYRLKINLVPRLTKETKEVKFFSTLPYHIGFNHRDILCALGY